MIVYYPTNRSSIPVNNNIKTSRIVDFLFSVCTGNDSICHYFKTRGIPSEWPGKRRQVAKVKDGHMQLK